MRIFTHKDVSHWDESLCHVEIYMNSTPIMTSYLPTYKAVDGRDMNLPINVVVDDKVPQVKHTLESMQEL